MGDGDEIRLKFSEVFPILRKFVVEYDVADIDLLDSHNAYKQRARDEQGTHPYALGSIKDGVLNRCDRFDVGLLEQNVDEFDWADVKERDY
ncbi:hypothetical protein [Halobaculum gomorrense]|uniref:Uncharacterized protein n=1 Tax=Halobaculum gomorrense TaxID=43928 RepID=A0A1M5S359_9EURY|nr:hypothetical protein [Halobaculum gomorrense]SHH32870.1 hypothetical protein SAMN05443636_2320 [Halobaculum gomorrense]